MQTGQTPPAPPQGTSAAEARILEREARTTLEESVRTGTPLSRVKRWAWRATALLFWAELGSLILGREGLFHSGLREATGLFRDLMVSTGFTPPDTRYLVPVLKVSWALLIANFQPVQVLGLLIYCFAAPLVFPVWLMYRPHLKRFSKEQLAEAKKRGVVAAKRTFHPRAFCATALLAWFLLYGDSAAGLHALLGAVVAAALFVSLILRSFSETRPPIGEDAPLLPRLSQIFLDVASNLVKTKRPETKLAAVGIHVVYGHAHRACRRLAILLRGRRGRNRVAAYVLAEYLLSLTTLGFAALLFWTLALKVYLAPSPVGNSVLLGHTLSKFVPGVAPTVIGQARPLWLDAGPGVTSFVLFVLFVGPAASLLPLRQQVYVKRVAVSYRHLRGLTLILGRYVRAAKRIADSLPAVS